MQEDFLKLVPVVRKSSPQLVLGKGEELCVILFGSKVKGEDNLLRDFDLLIITKDKEDMVLNIDFPADLFCYTLEDCLNEIKNKNTIFLDAFTQGKAIFDSIDVFDFLKNEVKYAVERSGRMVGKGGGVRGCLMDLARN